MTVMQALERYLFSTVLTIVLVVISAGLGWWIWRDRPNRLVPQDRDLIELRGSAHTPQARNRPSSVWFKFASAVQTVDGQPAPVELRVRTPETDGVVKALSAGQVPVVAWVVRAELGRGPREIPPTVMQLQVGSDTVLPRAMGQDARAQDAASARLSAWIAAGGIVVSLLVLAVHWVGRLRA